VRLNGRPLVRNLPPPGPRLRLGPPSPQGGGTINAYSVLPLHGGGVPERSEGAEGVWAPGSAVDVGKASPTQRAYGASQKRPAYSGGRLENVAALPTAVAEPVRAPMDPEWLALTPAVTGPELVWVILAFSETGHSEQI